MVHRKATLKSVENLKVMCADRMSFHSDSLFHLTDFINSIQNEESFFILTGCLIVKHEYNKSYADIYIPTSVCFALASVLKFISVVLNPSELQ
jgi:hypothetical protein